jgi:uncharacterized protein involved in exopolysaccharide biosynthesis
MASHDPTARTDWAGRPRPVASDLPALIWRERFLMLATFAAIAVLGLGAAMLLKTSYPATSSVLVRLGQEYVYEPRAGDAARGAVPDTGQLIQSETEILGSAPLKQRVIARLGLARIFPAMARKYVAADPAEKSKILAQAVHSMETATKIETAPDTPIIRVTYQAEDPQTAALVLNTLLEEYLIYRHGVLDGSDTSGLEQQRQVFEDRLAHADQAYQAFLNANEIGDFVAEKASLSQLQTQLEQQKLAAEAQLQDRLGRLSTLSGQLAGVAPEVGLYRDLSSAAADKLAQLKVQREDLLSRYRNDSRPVQELEAQIAQLEAGMAAGRTHGDGARRLGVNPVYQTLQTEKIQLTAEVSALRQTATALAGQIRDVREHQLKLAALEPQFQQLSLDRDVLQANLRDFTAKEAQSRAAEEIAQRGNDSIRIVSRATPPTKGKSLRKPVAILAVLFAAFTAVCIGVARMLLRPGLRTARSASRALDLPVLAQAPLKTY